MGSRPHAVSTISSAAASSTTDALDSIIHPDVRFGECREPDQPRGTERAAKRRWPASRKGASCSQRQSYDVHERVVDGDTIAARVTWRGTLAASGEQLTAHIATFTQVRDGKIYRHATYDCYERF